MLCTAPGKVVADTKYYLYLDPTRFVRQVASMWDPDVSMGTVTHQYIGYLLPMGPYYVLMEVLGVPVWVAQRLWTGSLLFLAGAGVLFLLRTLAPTATARPGSLDMGRAGGVGAAVAALAYMLSPYVLQNEARQSALLLPWVGLPWMTGLVARALRRGGWRHAALFALVVALVGSTNATSLVLVGAGPLLWVVWEVVGGRVHWRRALATALRIGVLSALVSLWWVEGLAVEGTYGMNVLRYTESIPTVARTTSAAETLRGLGYWFFYGVDKLGLYLPMAGPYMTSLWLLAVSFTVPAASFLAAFVVRWRERAYFVLLVLVGTVMSVGAHPLSDPSPLGGLIKAGATGSTVGLALRSTNRATPLVVLGMAVLLGAGVAALVRRWKVAGAIAAVTAAGLVAADLPALWTGRFVPANLSSPETVPAYWSQAATYLDAQPGAADTRVLTEPGIDFAAYRWGTTLDPVLPGLMTRPEVERGLVPYGSPGSANLLEALDEQVQAETFDPSALAPMLRLMSAGDLVLQSDLQYELYDTPRPKSLWQLLDPAPPGLGSPAGFGDPAVTAAEPDKFPLVDETSLGSSHTSANPPPVAVFSVAGARPILRTEGAVRPMLVDGDGSGLVAAAGAGLLDGQATVLYSPSFATRPAALQRQLAAGADLVVTDSDRRQAEQFGTVRENFGYTEQSGETPPVPDVRDAPLPLFPGAGDDTKTVAVEQGAKSVQASGYGNPITYTPENRPDQAMDGDLHTAWTVGALDDPVGQFLRITLQHPLTTDEVNLVQPLYGSNDRWITRATLRFDGGRPVTVDLGATSRTSGGQTVTFPSRTFTTLQITIDATNSGTHRSYDGQSAVGFAEVRLPGEQAHEMIRLPEDLLAAAGASSASHRLTFVMTRQRAESVPPRTDPEVDLARLFSVPTSRSFSVSGTAEVSPLAPDDVIDRLLGTTIPGVVAAYSSGRLPGDIEDRASATLDDDLSTVWSPGLGPQAGNWLEYDLAKPLSFDHLSMAVVADGRHSVPTSVTVSAGGQSRTVAVPPLRDSTTAWAAQTVPGLPGAHRLGRPRDLRHRAVGRGPRLLLGQAHRPAARHRRDGHSGHGAEPRRARRGTRTVPQRPAQRGRGARPGHRHRGERHGRVARPAARAGVRFGCVRHHAGRGVPRAADAAGVPRRRRRGDRQPRARLGRGRRPSARHGLGPCPAHRVRAGAHVDRRPLVGHVGHGRRAPRHRAVLDGAGREHQRRVARHHRYRAGPRTAPARRRVRQRMAGDAGAGRVGHGHHLGVDPPARRARRPRRLRSVHRGMPRPGAVAAGASSPAPPRPASRPPARRGGRHRAERPERGPRCRGRRGPRRRGGSARRRVPGRRAARRRAGGGRAGGGRAGGGRAGHDRRSRRGRRRRARARIAAALGRDAPVVARGGGDDGRGRGCGGRRRLSPGGCARGHRHVPGARPRVRPGGPRPRFGGPARGRRRHGHGGPERRPVPGRVRLAHALRDGGHVGVAGRGRTGSGRRGAGGAGPTTTAGAGPRAPGDPPPSAGETRARRLTWTVVAWGADDG